MKTIFSNRDFIPHDGDEFWYYTVATKDCHKIEKDIFDNSNIMHLYLFRSCNCFSSESEAKFNLDPVQNMYGMYFRDYELRLAEERDKNERDLADI